jgi:RHS repeat-associated protein
MWPADAVETVVLNSAAGTYVLTDLDGNQTTFGSTLGEWRSSADRWGNATSGGYTGGNLTTITDAEGRAWILGYSSGKLTSVTDPDANVWSLGYDGTGHLSTIRDPFHASGNPWRQYTYVTAGGKTLLVEIQDGSLAVLEGHEYDSVGRAISSWSADTTVTGGIPHPGPNAKDLVTISYDSATQTSATSKVDSATSETFTITYSYPSGRILPSSLVGSCSSCGGGADQELDTYDAFNHPVTKVLGLGAEQQETDVTYDANGMVLTRVEAVGKPETRTTTYAYGYAAGTPGTPSGGPPWPSFATSVTETSVAKPAGSPKLTTYSWNSSGTRETQLTTNVSGYLLSTDSSQTIYTTTSTFDGTSTVKHRLLEVDGPDQTGPPPLPPPSNRKTTYAYYADNDATVDRRGRLQTTSVYTSATAHLDTTYDNYDIFGTARKVVDPSGVETDKTTDAKGRVLTVKSLHVTGDPGEATDYTTTYSYDTRDRLTSLTMPAGNQIQYLYEDGTNRLTDTIRADATGSHNQQERLDLTMNVIGDKIQEDAQSCNSPAPNCSTWTTKRTESFKYDTHNRLSEIDHPVPSGSKILYAYDSRGNLKTVQDENHASANTTYAYDFLNRLTSVTQTLAGAAAVSGACSAASGNVATCYRDLVGNPGYDTQDNLTSVIDPNGNQTTYAYDDFRRMQSQVSPVSLTTSYSYDAAGNLIKSVDARQAAHLATDGTTRSYDAANRIVRADAILTGQPTETTQWSYDDPDLTQHKYRQGRLNSMTDPSGSTTYAYERRGLLKRDAKTIDLNTYTLAFAYDSNGNRTSLTYPSGRAVGYTFDFADRPLSASSGATTYVSSAGYQPFGPESSLSYGNGTTRTMTYDQRYRPTELKLLGTNTIYDYFYGEDAVGNITSMCDANPCASPTLHAYDRTFGYDDLNRLTTAQSGSSLWGNATGNGYAYDSMGNVKTVTLGTSGTFRTATFAYSGTTPKLASTTESGGLGMRTVSYDASGNETTVGSGSFTYSPRNYLATGDGLAYEYDGRGLRVATARTSVTLFPVRLTLASISALGGTTVTGTVTLNDTTSTTVSLASSDAIVASVPATATASGGIGTFTITTFPVASDAKVTITATLNGVAVTAVLTVTHNPTLILVSFSPRTVHYGSSSTGTVTLNGGAPSGGAAVTLTSSSGVVTFPGGSTVTIPVGQTSQTFAANTSTVTSSISVDVTASYGGTNQHASLVVVPFAVELRRLWDGQPVKLAALNFGKGLPFLAGPPEWDLTHSLRPGWLAEAVSYDSSHDASSETAPEAIEAALAASPPGPPKRNFIYSPEMNLLAESELSWPREKAILYEYVWFNGHPVAQIDSGTTTHWTFTDHLGTPLIQTTATQAGWWRAEYEPYGRVWMLTTADQHQPLRLPGQEAEQFNLGSNGSTERSYNVFRWYRAGWGRYTQSDPIFERSGLKKFPEPGLYSYVDGNPIMWDDPLGLQSSGAPTIQCDGKGNYEVVNTNHKCDRECTQVHEETHIRDWKRRYGENSCRNKKRGYLPIGGSGYDDFLKRSECSAYAVGYGCRVTLSRGGCCADAKAGMDRDEAQMEKLGCP